MSGIGTLLKIVKYRNEILLVGGIAVALTKKAMDSPEFMETTENILNGAKSLKRDVDYRIDDFTREREMEPKEINYRETSNKVKIDID